MKESSASTGINAERLRDKAAVLAKSFWHPNAMLLSQLTSMTLHQKISTLRVP